MGALEINGRKYEIDEEGFLEVPENWNEAVARELATIDGLTEMTDVHWRVLNYIRQYWTVNNAAPLTRELCKETGLKLTEIYDLFPSGPVKGAYRIAGLPKPPGCV
jgi:TusE/DsrC/DsvC family sulfur relay protein